MPSVDRRVVEMEFNNDRFEGNAQATISTLDKLKSALHFPGASKGLSDINTAANNVNFASMESSLDSLNNRFSTLGIIGMTVIQRLTNAGINGFNKIIGQITQGGLKRALNLEQARFQFKSLLGQDIKDTKALSAEVEKYMGNGGPIQKAVKGTAYGLDEAARVGSQLMASGIKDTKSMEGALTAISGVAAMTGSSYSDVGEIFTTVAGNGKLMTQQLRQFSFRGLNASATLAKYLNHVSKGAHVTEADVNEMVTKGEIDFKTFAKAMEWAFGDSAKKANDTFTGSLSNVKAALSRLGAEIYVPGLEGMRKIFVALIPVIDAVHSALNNLIKPIMGGFTKATSAVAKFLSSLTTVNKAQETVFKAGNQKFSKNLSDTFKGLASAVDLIGRALAAVLKTIFPFAKSAGSLLGVILSITGALGRLITRFDNFIKSSKTAAGIMEVIRAAFTGVANGISNIFNGLANIITNAFTPNVKKAGKAVDDLSGHFNIFNSIAKAVTKVFTVVNDAIKKGLHNISEALTGNNREGLYGIFAGLFVYMGYMLKKTRIFLGKYYDAWQKGSFKPLFEYFDRVVLQNVMNAMDNLNNTLKAYQENLKADTLRKISIAILILASAMMMLASIDGKKLAESVAGIGAVMAELMLAMAALSMIINGGDLKFMQAFKLGMLFDEITAAMINMSISVAILSGAVKALSKISGKDLLKSLGAVASLMIMLGGMAKFLSSSDISMKRTSQFIILAASIQILTSALKKLAGLKLTEIGKGLLGLAGILGSLAAFVSLVNGKSLSKVSGGLIAFGTGIYILASAMKVLSGINAGGIVKSLASLGAIFAGIAALNAVLKSNNLSSSAVGILIFAGAVKILAEALKVMSQMSGKEIAKSLITLAASVGILVGAMSLLSGIAPSIILVSVAFGILAKSMLILGPALIVLGSIPIGNIVKALVTLVAALGIFAAAAAFLTPVIPAMLALSAAMAVLGAAVTLLGVGITSLSTGLAAFAATASTVIASADLMAQAAVQMIASFLSAILKDLPKLAVMGGKIIVAVLKGLAKNMGKIVTVGAKVIVNFIRGITKNMGKIIQAAFNLIIKFINALARAIDNNSARLGAAGGRLVRAIVRGTAKAAWAMASEMFGAGANVIKGFIRGINAWIPRAIAAIGGLGSKALAKIRKILGIHSPSTKFKEIGKYTVLGFVSGIRDNQGSATKAMEEFNRSIMGLYGNTSISSNNPVITPVLDLSEVKKSASSVNGLLSNQTIGVGLGMTNDISTVDANSNILIEGQAKIFEAIAKLAENSDSVDVNEIYAAVRQGASDANISMRLNNRELSREMKNMGVVFNHG